MVRYFHSDRDLETRTVRRRWQPVNFLSLRGVRIFHSDSEGSFVWTVHTVRSDRDLETQTVRRR